MLVVVRGVLSREEEEEEEVVVVVGCKGVVAVVSCEGVFITVVAAAVASVLEKRETGSEGATAAGEVGPVGGRESGAMRTM